MEIGNYIKIDWSTLKTDQSEERNGASNKNKLDIAIQIQDNGEILIEHQIDE